MNQIVEDAKAELVAEAKNLLTHQTPSDHELAEIEWAAGILVFAGFNAISPVPTTGSANAKGAYAVLQNIAARHAVIAQFDAEKAMGVFISNATTIATKFATVAITAALAAA